MRVFALAGLAALLSSGAFGQSALSPAAQKFEISDVHTTPFSPYQFLGPVLYRNGRYELRNATLLNLITTAFAVPPERIVDRPDWLTSDRFDVIANASPDTNVDTLNTMLRTLLADRFGLSLRNESRAMPGYALVVGEKPAGDSPLRRASGAEPGSCKAPSAGGRGIQQGPTDVNGNRTILSPEGMILYECRNISMFTFSELLRRMSVQDFGNSPLVDQTGLPGAWDFDFTYSVMRSPDMPGLRTVFVAVSQLGLKIQPNTMPAPVMAIDRANRSPSSNPADVEKILPPRSTEFESVVFSPPDGPGNMGQLRGPGPNGRVDLRGQTLQGLIALAWNVELIQVVNGPAFLTTAHPEMVGQAPVTTTARLRQAIDPETNRIMMQNMLKTRFKLESHQGARTMDVFILSAPGPKLTKASGSGRTGCLNLDAEGKELTSYGMTTERHISCLNMTMAHFAEMLPNFAANMFMGVPRTVVDETEIDGTWDFNFVFTGFGAPPGPRTSAALQPTLPEVLAVRFGLNLEVASRPQPVIVIDHVEENPTDK